jgi:lysozyme
MIGIDVSVHQKKIDWEKAKSAGVQFAFIRATFGQSLSGGKMRQTTDDYFTRNWEETKRLGIPRGAYGWVRVGQDQKANANHFVSLLGDDVGELAPVCDFEKYQGKPNFAELRQFVERVRELTGRIPYIYTSGGYWRGLPGYKNQVWAGEYPLWHAQYTTAKTPTLMYPWDTWTFWQYSATGNRRGAEFGAASSDIDINRFNGDALDFQKLIGEDVSCPAEEKPKDINLLKAKIMQAIDDWAK